MDSVQEVLMRDVFARWMQRIDASGAVYPYRPEHMDHLLNFTIRPLGNPFVTARIMSYNRDAQYLQVLQVLGAPIGHSGPWTKLTASDLAYWEPVVR